MTIRNSKIYKHNWHLIMAVVMLVLAVYSLFDREWLFVAVFSLNALAQIRLHYDLRKTAIRAVILNAESIEIVRGNELSEIVPVEQIDEIPMNSRCARIDYRDHENPRSLLLQDSEFTPDCWTLVQVEFRRISTVLEEAKN